MHINSHTTKEEIARFFGVSEAVAYYLKNIFIEECHSDTKDVSKEDMAQIVETAERFAEENE